MITTLIKQYVPQVVNTVMGGSVVSPYKMKTAFTEHYH